MNFGVQTCGQRDYIRGDGEGRHQQSYGQLEQPTPYTHAQSRGLDTLDASFYLYTGDRYAHRIINPRRLTDQPHCSRLRLALPFELHRLNARPVIPPSHRSTSKAIQAGLLASEGTGKTRAAKRTTHRIVCL